MNNNKKKYNYGKCHVCGEQMQEKKINQDFWLKGKLVVIESVPAGVCPQCGEKIVKADVGRQLAKLIANLSHGSKRKTITVPVIKYAKEAAWVLVRLDAFVGSGFLLDLFTVRTHICPG